MRAEDSTPSSEVARSLELLVVATFQNLPGLRLPHLLPYGGPGGGPLPWASRLFEKGPLVDLLPGASEITTPALLLWPEEARPPSAFIKGFLARLLY